MGNLKELFQGISVVIDDEIDQEAQIDKIIESIEQSDCHVVKMKKIPKEATIKNLHGASFFIMDWTFRPPELAEGVQIPAGLKKNMEEENIKFLQTLKSTQFAPIFIFTNEAIDVIRGKLKKNNLIKDDDGDHIFVLSKSDVLKKGLFKTLEAWIKGHPSAYVLKKWDQSYISAKNRLFVDFYKNSRFWPVVIWDTCKHDRVSPSFGLGNLIVRNITSRMSPVEFDEEILGTIHKHQIENITASEIKNVLVGERFIEHEFLPNSYSTGDIFFKKDNKKDRIYINIRPECDCVNRDGKEVDMTILYLLKGVYLSGGQIDSILDREYGLLEERDEESIIFCAFKDKTVRFGFKELKIQTIKELNENGYQRLGRLIPPFSTRLIQRFSAYSQRSGLPAIPSGAHPKPATAKQA